MTAKRNAGRSFMPSLRNGPFQALALDDGVAAHFVGSERSRVVSSRPNARAYEVHVDGDETVETELPVELLTKHDRV